MLAMAVDPAGARVAPTVEISLVKRQSEALALGYVATRVLESTIIVVGLIGGALAFATAIGVLTWSPSGASVPSRITPRSGGDRCGCAP